MSGFQNLSTQRGWFEPIRTLAFGAVLDAYSAIGTAIGYPTRVFIINNFTDIAIHISFDGVNDHIAIPAGGHIVIDSATDGIALPKSTVFYAKRYTPGGAATSGAVDISIGYHDRK